MAFIGVSHSIAPLHTILSAIIAPPNLDDIAYGPSSWSALMPRQNVTILEFESIPKDELDRLEKCYTWYHPDAKSWLPYQPRHPFNSFWARFEPSDIYYVGGFGE